MIRALLVVWIDEGEVLEQSSMGWFLGCPFWRDQNFVVVPGERKVVT
jgi:hypothetical protein